MFVFDRPAAAVLLPLLLLLGVVFWSSRSTQAGMPAPTAQRAAHAEQTTVARVERPRGNGGG